METEKLISTNRGNDTRCQGRPSLWLLGVMWILGTLGRHSSSPRTSTISGTLSTIIVPVTLTISSSASAVLYLICFFGRSDHFLRFLSFLSYWISMLTPQLVCTVACLMNFKKSACATHRVHIRWFRVFDGASFLEGLRCQNDYTVKFGMLLVFLALALPAAVAKAVYFNEMEKSCRDWIEFTWLFCDILNVTFFALFCYFLYLRRISLEEKAISASEYINRNVGRLNNCIQESRELFREYQQLRTFILPWLNMAIFSSSFGLTVFVTWNYEDVADKSWNATTTASTFIDQFGLQSICTYTCDQESYMKQSRVFVPFNVLMFCRYMMIAASALIVVKGLDVMYVWERFKTRLFFSYSAEDRKFWKILMNFVKKLHPNTTADIIFSFLIPLLGLASGMLGGKHF